MRDKTLEPKIAFKYLKAGQDQHVSSPKGRKLASLLK